MLIWGLVSLARREVVVPLLVILVFSAPIGVDGTGLYSTLVLLANSMACWPAHLVFRYILYSTLILQAGP